MSTSTVIIVDSLNYIKGYRYELYCIAREQGTSSCCVYVTLSDAEAEQRRQAASSIPGQDTYTEDVFHELRRRFEVPVPKNRWEAPLFEVNMSLTAPSPADGPPLLPTPGAGTEAAAVFTSISAAAASAGDLQVPKVSADASEQAVKKKSSFRRFKSALKRSPIGPDTDDAGSQSVTSSVTATTAPPAVGTTMTCREGGKDLWFSGSTKAREAVRGTDMLSTAHAILAHLSDPTQVHTSAATVRVPHADAGLLTQLDAISQQVVSQIAAHQRDHVEGTPIMFRPFDRSLTLNRRVTLTELQRHRQQFIRVNVLYAPKEREATGAAFVDFLADNI